jgi:hypothetical protein
MLAHTKGREGNLPAGTKKQSLWMPNPLDGVPGALATDHPLCHFLPHSVCSGWHWPNWRVLPENLELLQAHGNHGANFGYGSHIQRCSGTSCEELDKRVNMGLLCYFTVHVRACRFASLVVTLHGYKTSGRPCTHLCPLAWTPITPSPPSLCLKRKRGR